MHNSTSLRKVFLYRSMVDNGHKFEAAVVPERFNPYSFTHRSQSVQPQWISKDLWCNPSVFTIGKGMRKHILVHCKSCGHVCQTKCNKKHNSKSKSLNQVCNQWSSICINLIGEFYPPSSIGNRYTLTAVCMLTGFTFCIPIKNKTAQEVVTAWRNHISFPFGVCRKLLTDNGTEFKNDLFSQVAE